MNKKRTIYLITNLVFVMCMAVSAFIIDLQQKKELKYFQEHIRQIVDTSEGSLKEEFHYYAEVSRELESLLIENNGIIFDFEKIYRLLAIGKKNLDSIIFAPNGIISCVYPEESKYNIDYQTFFNKTKNSLDTIYSQDKLKLSISRPFNLKNGKSIITVTNPVYLPAKNGEEEVFWGYIILTLNYPDVFISNELIKALDFEKCEYKLWFINKDFESDTLLASYAPFEFKNPINYIFENFEGKWTFSIEPRDGWINIKYLIIKCIFAIFINFFVTFVVLLLCSLENQQKILMSYSFEDTLTSLYNSRMYHKKLAELQEKKNPFGVIYIDLNSFKPINDNYGHHAGDLILEIAARKFRNCIRDKDMAFRIGGDEFSIIIIGDDADDIAVKCDILYEDLIARIKQSFDIFIMLDDVRVKVGVSAGYAIYPRDGNTAETIVEKAELLMYKDKRESKAGR